jgi:fumarate reductase flavoprotein subunit
MQRRDLLICSSLALLGGPALAVSRQEVTDLVVIGSGGTGLTAALSALAAGVRVMVLEKMPITGGNTQLAAGGMNAAETRPQAARKIVDSWKTMYDDTMKGGQNRNNAELVEILARQSSASIDWLLAQGADMTGVGPMAGARVDPTHPPPARDPREPPDAAPRHEPDHADGRHLRAGRV